ncbi:MAG TPA: hypothetical protein VEW69_12730 [Alphaproteobacteria bacterium]|nr:hypothetical protein [Alphaproteobacteria bacterium]
MKRLYPISLLIALLLPATAIATNKLDAVVLKGAEVPADCKVIDGTFPVDIQTQVLYEHYDAYSKLLPPLQGRKALSLQCGNQIGTLYYFEFADVASRERAEGFIRNLLWGADHPSADHPEQIAYGSSLLCVISFESAPESLLAAVRVKLPGGTSSAVQSAAEKTPADGADTAQALSGDWHGMSICAVKPSGCHDEESLYHIKSLAGQPGRFSMQGDKIVNGQPVTMGTVDCSYDAPKRFLHCEGDHGSFDFTLQGDRLEGSMSLPDNTRWREIKLARVKQ